MSKYRSAASTALCAAVAAFAISACGSSSSGSSTSTSSSSSAAKADVTGARAAIAPYVGKPSAFPVDQPLPRALPKGQKIAYLQCSTPVCAVFANLYAGAAKMTGATLQVTKASASADSLQSAFSSIVEKRPAGILIPGIEPSAIAAQMKSSKLPIAANGIMDGEKFGIGGVAFGRPMAVLAGRLLADWVVVNSGPKSKVVFYDTPELGFIAPMRASFSSELAQRCPGCEARVVKLPITSIGTTAPNQVVSDLQSHPGTSVAVYGSQEAETGVPTALKTAGLKVKSIGFAPTPGILQEIKAGNITAGLGIDIPVMLWTVYDMLQRQILKAPLTDVEKTTTTPMQFLTSANLTGDVSKGWSGYPDFAQRFARLWHVS